MIVRRWSEFASAEPALAGHCATRLGSAPSYLATVRPDGWPRVHPVGPLELRAGNLFVTMYPRSPKGHDLRRNRMYALHCGVEDVLGGGGEALVTGAATAAEPAEADISSGYVLFELLVGAVVSTRYEGDDWHPVRDRWSAS